jgi:DNA-binding beta-propeller fold protein YncE
VLEVWRGVFCLIANPGLLTYPSFISLDGVGNVVVANSGCDTLVVLDRVTGHVLAAASIDRPCGVHVTEKHEFIATSTTKHCLTIF